MWRGGKLMLQRTTAVSKGGADPTERTPAFSPVARDTTPLRFSVLSAPSWGHTHTGRSAHNRPPAFTTLGVLPRQVPHTASSRPPSLFRVCRCRAHRRRCHGTPAPFYAALSISLLVAWCVAQTSAEVNTHARLRSTPAAVNTAERQHHAHARPSTTTHSCARGTGTALWCSRSQLAACGRPSLSPCRFPGGSCTRINSQNAPSEFTTAPSCARPVE